MLGAMALPTDPDSKMEDMFGGATTSGALRMMTKTTKHTASSAINVISGIARNSLRTTCASVAITLTAEAVSFDTQRHQRQLFGTALCSLSKLFMMPKRQH